MFEARMEIKWNDLMGIPLVFVPAVIRQKLQEAGFKLKPYPFRIFLTAAELQAMLEGTVYEWDTMFGRMIVQRVPEATS